MLILSPLAGWAFTLFIRKFKIYGAHEYFVFVLIKKVNKKILHDYSFTRHSSSKLGSALIYRNNSRLPKKMSSAFLQWLSAAG
jgi:hypothetical protein